MEVILSSATEKSDSRVLNYIKYNLVGGLKVSPLRGIGLWLLPFIGYVGLALPVGFGAGVIELKIAEPKFFLLLPFTLLIFPSLLEEAFFRGVLIPRNVADRGTGWVWFFALFSSLVFTAWHPLNALTINPGAKEIFLNPWFLLITFMLGLSCSLGYIYSRSLWVPLLMHWLTVLVWVLFLDGRNFLLG